MRKIILIAAIIAAALISMSSGAQTFTVNKAGEIKTAPAKTIKKPDTVYKIVNGVTIYKGSKGGYYYMRTSKKTGQPYKCYLKKEE